MRERVKGRMSQVIQGILQLSIGKPSFSPAIVHETSHRAVGFVVLNVINRPVERRPLHLRNVLSHE